MILCFFEFIHFEMKSDIETGKKFNSLRCIINKCFGDLGIFFAVPPQILYFSDFIKASKTTKM